MSNLEILSVSFLYERTEKQIAESYSSCTIVLLIVINGVQAFLSSAMQTTKLHVPVFLP